MADHRIVVTRRPPGGTLDWLTSIGSVWTWGENRPIPNALLATEIAEATGIYCMLTDRIDAELLDLAPDLLAVSQMAVGVDNKIGRAHV